MEIRPARTDEIDRVMQIYADGRRALADLGIDQWQNGDPQRATVEGDIARGESFVGVDDAGDLAIVAMLGLGGEPDYDEIDGAWLMDSPASDPSYLVVHRIATAADHARQGWAHAMFSFAEQRAAEVGRASVRIDTHAGNVRMRTLLSNLGFTECGMITLGDSTEFTRERIAFEKLVVG